MLSRCLQFAAAAMSIAFAIAAFTKLLHLSEFSASLAKWHIIPPQLSDVAAVVLCTVESMVLIAWLSGMRAVQVCILSALILMVFTVAYALEMALNSAPECGCFGKLAAFELFQQQGMAILVRNGAVMTLLTLLILLDWRVRQRIASEEPSP